MRPSHRLRVLLPLPLLLILLTAQEHPGGRYPAMPAEPPPIVDVPDAEAATEAEMKPYRERIVAVDAHSAELQLEMVPVPSGEFLLGSPPDEPGRGDLESPQRSVKVSAFWMASHETTWDLYRVFMFDLDRGADLPDAAWADAVSRPTPPYRPMDFGMGVAGYPAISMTQLAARQFTKWLTMKTGRFHRLPTEAEWEYACRAGAATAWSFGNDPAEADRYAWHAGNSDHRYQQVARLEPNGWGLFDLHGNVAEWVLDAYASWADLAEGAAGGEPLVDPIAWPTAEYPRSVRGGSWQDDPNDLRCAARRGSEAAWKRMDPQIPQSVWYHTNARFLGFRVVRPLHPPPAAEWERFWEPDVDSARRIVERQRQGERD